MILSPKLERLLESAHEMRASGKEIDDVLAGLRAEGATPIDSIKVLVELENIDLGQAKVIIDASPAWRDARESNHALRQAFIRTWDEIQDAEANGTQSDHS